MQLVDTAFYRVPASFAVMRGPDLVYLVANHEYCRLVGSDQLCGRSNRDVSAQFLTKAAEIVYRSGKPFVDHELRMVFSRGDRPANRYFDTTISPIRDEHGSVEGVSVFAVEVTAHVEGRSLAQVKRTEAERVAAAKDDFVAIASHELRNPLMAVLGWVRFLRAENLTATQLDRALERIELNALAQSRLIDNLLDIPRVGNGKLRLELAEVDFGDLVASVCDSMRPAIDAKGLRFEIAQETGPMPICADDSRLQQVVWNLLANAIKFTRKGGGVRVSLARRDGNFELAIADTGEGIPPQLLYEVFERYKQCDSHASGATQGLGLGLWIARDIIELHGGTIEARSGGIGHGATFVVSLPPPQSL